MLKPPFGSQQTLDLQVGLRFEQGLNHAVRQHHMAVAGAKGLHVLLALEFRASRQHDVGIIHRRRMIDIDDGEEVQAFNPSQGVVGRCSLQRERITERKRHANGILLIRHIVHGYPARCVCVLFGKGPSVQRGGRIVGAQPAMIETEAGARLAVVARDGNQDGGRMPQHIGIGVLVRTAQPEVDDSGPVVGITVGQHGYRLLRNAARLGRPLQRVIGQPFLHQGELGRILLAVNHPRAFERRLHAGFAVQTRLAGGLIPHMRRTHFLQRDDSGIGAHRFGAAVRLARRAIDQMYQRGVLLYELLVIPALVQDDAYHALDERRVRSRTHRKPLIGLRRRAGEARIDGDDMHAGFLGVHQRAGPHDAAFQRIVPQLDNGGSVRELPDGAVRTVAERPECARRSIGLTAVEAPLAAGVRLDERSKEIEVYTGLG